MVCCPFIHNFTINILDEVRRSYILLEPLSSSINIIFKIKRSERAMHTFHFILCMTGFLNAIQNTTILKKNERILLFTSEIFNERKLFFSSKRSLTKLTPFLPNVCNTTFFFYQAKLLSLCHKELFTKSEIQVGL